MKRDEKFKCQFWWIEQRDPASWVNLGAAKEDFHQFDRIVRKSFIIEKFLGTIFAPLPQATVLYRATDCFSEFDSMYYIGVLYKVSVSFHFKIPKNTKIH